ncbi:putative disease resistance protein RGA3 [Phragmites australis]|uniref:putative disease resistance protein RGA3 n=1 Tax=Phragmites australis TaxID=29695 RepID=UPI002D790C2B|nr:putative disease resistance protein RGA3 [Phragmites australis]
MDLRVVPTSSFTPSAGGSLRAWSARAGIGREVDGLGAVLDETKLVLAAARAKKELQNKALEVFLRELDYEVFHADSMLDDLEYCRIRTEVVEALEDGEASADEECSDGSNCDVFQQNSSSAESADPSASDSSKFQLVVYDENAKSLVPRVELDKDDILRRIWHHVNQLSKMQHDARKALKLEELDLLALRMNPADMDLRETTPLVTEPRIYGRDKERDQIADKLMSTETRQEDLSVFAVVGNGGVGKTALARLLYNDAIITKHFQLRVWIYVSVNFDEIKLTHDLLECLYDDRFERIEDMNKLQQFVEDAVKSKRLLLVMDDIWEDHNTSRWDTFLAPLRRTQVTGNKVLVTTRKLSVAKMTGAKDSIKLDGLLEADFWSLFKECAFGNGTQMPKLVHIGRQIAKKLKGYPLAAKTVGTLLRRKLDTEHWVRVLDSDEWKHQQGSEDIIPALRISYNHLPFPLQRCFSYCALFPKNHHFNTEQLVNVWIAQGFVCSKEGKIIEDVGNEYFNELVQCGFIQYEAPRLSYIMHDLIHDLAQMISSDECLTIDAPGCSTKSKLIRHISVITESMYRPKGDGSMIPNEYFEQEFVNSIDTVQSKNLGTIMLIGRYDSSFSEVFREKFHEFKAVRVLKLEMMFDSLGSLICDIAAFTHLRYLELRAAYSYSSLQLPEAISSLYRLEVLDIRHNWGIHTELPRGLNNIVNLRHFLAIEKLHEQIVGVGKLKFLQELKAFKVKKKKGFDIGQLGNLMELRGSLKISGIENVKSTEEAAMAKLKDKVYLRSLHLSWDKKQRDSAAHTLALEGFQPYASLESLRVDGHRGYVSTWLATNFSLTRLRSLYLESCQNWRAIPPIEKLPFLKELHLVRMFRIRELIVGPLEVLELREMNGLTKCTVLDEEYSSKSIRVLEIVSCYQLEKVPFLQSFSDIEHEQQLLNLQRVQIHECPKSADLPSFPVNKILTDIDIADAGSTRSMSFRLKHVVGSDGLSITIKGGPYLSNLDEKILAFHNITTLEEMEIIDSRDLTYLAWNKLRQLTFLKRFAVSSCPKVFCSLPTGYSLPPSLQDLRLSMCDVTGNQLTQLLINLPNLSNLEIAYCRKVTSLAVGFLSSGIDLMTEGLCHIPSHCLTNIQHLHISSDMAFLSNKGLGDFICLRDLIIRGCAILLTSMVQRAGTHSILPSSLHKLHIDALPDTVFQHSNLTSLVQLDVEHSPSLTTLDLHSFKNLRNLVIKECNLLTSCEGLQNLIFLSKMVVKDCPSMVSLPLHSCQALQHLHVEDCNALCTLESLVCLPLLSELHLLKNHNLVSFKLHPHAALQSLKIQESPALSSWGDLKSLAHLNHLEIRKAPGFVSMWNRAAQDADIAGQEFFFPLKTLQIDDIGFLTTAVCRLIPSLSKLSIGFYRDSRDVDYQVSEFTEEQQGALKLLKRLECLEFLSLMNLQMLPSEIRSLPSLQHLIIWQCGKIKSLPQKGLPASLKLLDVDWCSSELYDQCRDVKGLQWLYIRGREQNQG